MSFITQVDIEFEKMQCGGCDIIYYVPATWLKIKSEEKASFSCPNGCTRVFVGETEIERLQKLLRQKQEELANKASEKIQLENQLTLTQKKLKRVHNGTCPCCKRSFQNLKKHMASKHPELIK